jgi:cell division protease FtsH
MEDIEQAKDKVLMGSERRSMVMGEVERKTSAWHEAGHTVVGTLIKGNDPVHKVSIIPRGAALGVTMFLPTEDRHLMTRSQTMARIAMALGGRVAEEEAFGEITTGASDDIKRATRLARAMVCELGMSEKMGPIAYGENEENVFLGREMSQKREDYSEATSREIDEEVRRIIVGQYELTQKTIRENRDKLDRLAHALLERETLDSEEIKACMDGVELPKPSRVVIPTWNERKREEKKNKTERGPLFSGPAKPAGGEA